MSCNGTDSFYCSPSDQAMLYENQTYALQWNAIWDTLYFDPTVDVYLYHADNNAPTNKILRVPNDGLMTFSIDEDWFTSPASSNTQLYPYQFYVVGHGQVYNLDSSSSTLGPTFYAAQLPSSATGAATASAEATATGLIPIPAITSAAGTRSLFALPTSTGLASDTSPTASVAATVASSKAGLSGGAIAGITIGVATIAAAFIAALFFLTRRRRQDKVRLDSESDVRVNQAEGEKGGFKVFERDSGSSTSMSSNDPKQMMDVPLAFTPGTAPATPSSVAETPRIPFAPASPRDPGGHSSATPRGSMDVNRPPRSPNRDNFQLFPAPAGERVPPSPKFPVQSSNVLPPPEVQNRGPPPPAYYPGPRPQDPRPRSPRPGPPRQGPPVNLPPIRNSQDYPGSRSPRPGPDGPPYPPPKGPPGSRPPLSQPSQDNPTQAFPQQVQVSQMQPQPVQVVARQNSRRGMIPPFPIDPSSRKPVANRDVTNGPPVPSHRSQPSDRSLAADETPLPTQTRPQTPPTLNVPQGAAVERRPPSIKSVVGKVEEPRSTDSPPSTPKPVLRVEVPKVGQPIPAVTPSVTIAAATPVTSTAAEKEAQNKQPRRDSVPEPRLSIAETDIPTPRTSLLNDIPSRVSSGIFESQSRGPSVHYENTPPLVIAKLDHGVHKGEEPGLTEVAREEVKEKTTEHEEHEEQHKIEDKLDEHTRLSRLSIPPVLPALQLEESRPISFDDLG